MLLIKSFLTAIAIVGGVILTGLALFKGTMFLYHTTGFTGIAITIAVVIITIAIYCGELDSLDAAKLAAQKKLGTK
jgi:hypothetical protein